MPKLLVWLCFLLMELYGTLFLLKEIVFVCVNIPSDLNFQNKLILRTEIIVYLVSQFNVME